MFRSLFVAVAVALIAVCFQFGALGVLSRSACKAATVSCSWTHLGSEPGQDSKVAKGVVVNFASNERTFPNDVIALTEELVSIPSASGTEHAAGRYIASWLGQRGWHVSTPPAENKGPESRFNVLALPSGLQGRADIRVVMSTHFDTVPTGSGKPRIEGGRLYGRGAVDAKGIVASMMVAGQDIVARNSSAPIALLFVCGEETDHSGMIAANQLGLPTDIAFVNGEPTTGKLCVNQKGILKLQLTAYGIACHSGYPELGKSAVEILLDGLGRLRGQKWPVDEATGAKTTMNIGVISGGSAANVVPGHSTAAISFRIVSDVDLVIEQVHEAIRGLANITTAFGTRNPPQVHYAPPRALATFGSYTAAYNTDLSYFRHAEKKVLFGGGTIANAHVEDEYIDLKDLEAMPNQYEMIVGELLEEQWARGQPANTK